MLPAVVTGAATGLRAAAPAIARGVASAFGRIAGWFGIGATAYQASPYASSGSRTGSYTPTSGVQVYSTPIGPSRPSTAVTASGGGAGGKPPAPAYSLPPNSRGGPQSLTIATQKVLPPIPRPKPAVPAGFTAASAEQMMTIQPNTGTGYKADVAALSLGDWGTGGSGLNLATFGLILAGGAAVLLGVRALRR